MKPVVLCILDGCGIREESDGNAFKNANKPTLDMLYNKYNLDYIYSLKISLCFHDYYLYYVTYFYIWI